MYYKAGNGPGDEAMAYAILFALAVCCKKLFRKIYLSSFHGSMQMLMHT